MKYLVYFYEFEPFHGKNLEKRRFWIAEYDLNTDLRSFNHRRTNRTELREISKVTYDNLSSKQKDRVIVRKNDGT